MVSGRKRAHLLECFMFVWKFFMAWCQVLLDSSVKTNCINCRILPMLLKEMQLTCRFCFDFLPTSKFQSSSQHLRSKSTNCFFDTNITLKKENKKPTLASFSPSSLPSYLKRNRLDCSFQHSYKLSLKGRGKSFFCFFCLLPWVLLFSVIQPDLCSAGLLGCWPQRRERNALSWSYLLTFLLLPQKNS